MPPFCEECPVHVLPTLLHPLANPFDIALCRLAGAVPASFCSAKCGIQRGGDLSSCQARSVGGQSSSPVLPHGRSRQEPIGCLPKPKCPDTVHYRPGRVGVLSIAIVMSFHKAKSTLPLSLWPLGQTSYQQQQHLHSLQDRFATSTVAKAHPPLVSLVRLTQPTRVS